MTYLQNLFNKLFIQIVKLIDADIIQYNIKNNMVNGYIHEIIDNHI